MKRRIIITISFAALPLLLAACAGSGSNAECARDGDCPINWRCDAYARICRCVDDQACNAAANEVCMPDGTCQVYTGCQSDQECGSCHRCEVGTGECLCTEDCGCADTEVCNASGFCQPKTGCFDNADCAMGEICDTPSKKCIAAGTCTTKYQCAFAQICNNGSCVSGCEDHGDCPLRWACINGSCVEGTCPEDSFCEFMEYCNNGTCTDAYNEQWAPYCKPCANVSLDECGQRSNPCLIYPFVNDDFANAGHDNYCGVDCSAGQRCPNGFSCSTIITVKQSDICQSNLDCPGGLPCLKPPEEDHGFCPCHNASNPCMANTCIQGDMCMGGRCYALALSGIQLDCAQDSDCNLCQVTMDHCLSQNDCPSIQCELYDGVDYGGCVSAKACGLDEGLHCIP